MPFRLIGTIILLLVVTVFAGANLDNRCDINFVFIKIQQVPVFLTAVASFLIGAIIMIPFTFKKKCGKKQTVSEDLKNQESSQESEQKTLFDFKIKRDVNKNPKKDKKSWLNKGRTEEKSGAQSEKTAEEKASEANEKKSENSSPLS